MARGLGLGFHQHQGAARVAVGQRVDQRRDPARLLVDYPLGCDFTPVEQRLVRALGWLKSATATEYGFVAVPVVDTSGDLLPHGGDRGVDALLQVGYHSRAGLDAFVPKSASFDDLSAVLRRTVAR